MSEKPTKVALVSLGCPKNLVDSEKMLAQLAAGGCLVAAPMDDADVIVINTCGFLSAARNEALDAINEALEYKRTGRARRVVVAGCLVNRDGEELYESAAGIDAVIGVNNRDDLLGAVMGEGTFTRRDPRAAARPDDSGRFRLTPRHTAYLRISEGCSQRCTFCTVPQIRGPFRSKMPQQVIAEARELIADGAVELNVIGQDTTSYGRDLNGGEELGALLRSLDELDGVAWIRLMYAYPKHLSDAVIDAIAASPRVVPYVDLPLQHISDGVLQRMGRGVRRSDVEKLLRNLRSRVDDLAVRTTFIVGFPGESDDEFAELLDFVSEQLFDALGVFEYSPEEGTIAARMPDQVSDDVKAARAEAIMLAQQKIAFTAGAAKVGAPVEVLIDEVNADGRCIGRHRGQAPDIDGVCYVTGQHTAGRFVSAGVTGWDRYDLIVTASADESQKK